MYTFRFNPVFEQWVLLGEPIPQSLIIQDAHLIQPQPKGATNFVAATYPRQPFVLDPGPTKHHEGDLLYAPQAPVGEYELLLFTGQENFFTWKPAIWETWFEVLIERFRAFHLNPYLHYVRVNLATKALQTAGENYQRVGDLIATSHPIAGTAVSLKPDFVKRLTEKEKLFVVFHDEQGSLYVPTAPLHHHEIWYLPHHGHGVDTLPEVARKSVAAMLSYGMNVLHEEFPEAHWNLTLHTPMGKAGEWWLQIYEDRPVDSPLPLLPLPEKFTFLMRQLLAHHAQN